MMTKTLSILVVHLLLLPGTLFAAGNCMEGDCEQGYGIGMTSAGRLYQGEWQKGKPHGLGVFFLEQGKYEGQVENGKREGQGVMLFADGTRYEGHWHDDQVEGLGLFLSPDGIIYEGRFKSGLPEGLGVCQVPGGKRYEGKWHEGKPQIQAGSEAPKKNRTIAEKLIQLLLLKNIATEGAISK